MRRPPPLSALAQAQLLDGMEMRGRRLNDLLAANGHTALSAGRKLSLLRTSGWATSGALNFPARAGRPVELLSYVTLCKAAPGAIATFETYCRRDEAVTSAVALAGAADYGLWSFHEDTKAARAWCWSLRSRPEVRLVEDRIMRILFGHSLAGAPMFSS